MSLKIKEKPLEMAYCSLSTDCMPKYIKKEVLELSDNFSTNCMPLKIKEEPPELTDSSLSATCMPLNFKQVPQELSDNASLTSNMPLNITDEMPDNVFLKIEIEENPEPCDSPISPLTASKNDNFYSKIMDVKITDNIFERKNASEENISKTGGTSSCPSFPYTGETNVSELDLVNSSDTFDPESKNGFIRQTTNETSTMSDFIDAHNSSYNSLPSSVTCYSGSLENTNDVFLTNPQCHTNILPISPTLHTSNNLKHINDMVTKLKVVQHRNAWEVEYSDNVLRGVDDESLKTYNPSDRLCSENEQLSHAHARINDGVRTENVESLVNKNILSISKDPMSMINQNIPSLSKEKPNIPNDQNSAAKTVVKNNGKIWEIRDGKKNVVRGINKVRNESVDPTLNQNIPPISVENLIINPNNSNTLREKPVIIPNNPCIIKDGSSATEPASVQAGKVWEIRDEEHNVMRGINKGTLEHNKSILSVSKDPESTTNRNSPSITKEKPIINPNTPCNLSNDNSALKPAFLKAGKVWEIRDEQRNVIRGINKETLKHFFPKSLGASSSQNKSPYNECLEKGGKKIGSLSQSTKETSENPNKKSRLNSYTVRNLTFLVENSGKTTNITISDEHAESRERGLTNASQFKNMQDKEKSNPRSLLRSSHAAHSSTILTGESGESANEIRIAQYGRGALVYDRVNSQPRITTLTKLIQPLYKYIKDNKCLLCGFESKAADTFGVRRHLACHLPVKNLECDICGKYVSAIGLQAHKANMHNKSQPNFSCNECNLSFSNKATLITHQRKHHKPAKTYPCQVCNYKFKEINSLKEHCRIHTGERPFACTVCNETFRTRGMLNSHSLKHNKEKLYSCKLCEKSYNNKGLMTEHMNSHKETSDIKCDVCGKTFNYKSNLAQHMYTHSDKRPHKCETCGLKFKLSHHLRSHLATHHAC